MQIMVKIGSTGAKTGSKGSEINKGPRNSVSSKERACRYQSSTQNHHVEGWEGFQELRERIGYTRMAI